MVFRCFSGPVVFLGSPGSPDVSIPLDDQGNADLMAKKCREDSDLQLTICRSSSVKKSMFPCQMLDVGYSWDMLGMGIAQLPADELMN